jgi:teichuronic acid biosynthesis glycosyltransferase TuaC
MLRVLTLSTLFPDAARPRLGPFVERQTQELARHPDVDLRVVAPIGLPPVPFSRIAHYGALARLPIEGDWAGLRVTRPKFPHLPATGNRFASRLLTRTLTRHLEQIREDFPFDVIDAEFFFPDGPAAIELGRIVGVPVSIKARGSDIHFWASRPALRASIVGAGSKAQGLLAVSESLKRDMVALGMPEARIRVHYTGVDQDLFSPDLRGTARHRFGIHGSLVVCVGTLMKRKGQGILIDAVASLPDVELVLIGDGPDRADLEAQVARGRLRKRIRFTGSISHSEIAQWLAAADCMALASSSEGLANAWVEALASGTPVVTCDVGGAREVITDRDAGLLVAPTVKGFTVGLARILADPPSRFAVRQKAARFTWEANTAALYAHLQSLI